MTRIPFLKASVIAGFFLFLTGELFAQEAALSNALHYPVTRKVDQVDNYFGTSVADPYRWLENDTSEETRRWVTAQQRCTEDYLSKIAYRPRMLQRLKELANYPRYQSAFRAGEYIFFSKNDGLQNQYVYYYQKGLAGEPAVFLDPNQLSTDGSVSIVLDKVSPDKKYIAWHVNRNGSDWATEYVTEIAGNRRLSDSIQWTRGDGVAWYRNGFYYTRFPEPEKGKALTAVASKGKICYHELGQPQSADRLIYADAAHPDLYLAALTTTDGHYLLVFKVPGSTGYEVLCQDLTKKGSGLTLLFKGYDYQYNVVDNDGDRILVNTNDGANNFRVVSVDPRSPDRSAWKVVIPEKKETLEFVSAAGGKLLAGYLRDASSRVERYSYSGMPEQSVNLPGLGSAVGFDGFPDDRYVFYDFMSFIYPPSVFRYDLASGESEIFKRSEIKLDLDQYTTEQVFYTSRDSTKVPMFLIHKKGIALDHPHPTLLFGYGGFDISITPYFATGYLPVIENDGIYAVANIRGGGEYGEGWHRAGMLEKKQNVFDDFIAAAEYLKDKGYTSRERLAIMGGSNGGLLVGAVMTERPDLCRVAFPMVGVMDMLRFQKYTSGIFWVTEFGSSDSASQFPALYKYSPLHNIRSGTAYPATLVMTADHDDRVVPMHSFKFAATLQEKQAGAPPVLIRISTNQGHGASGSSLQKGLEASADWLSFLFYNMGIEPR